MLSYGRWELRHLPLEVGYLSDLWKKLQEYPTLFSDETRGDIRNWISMIRDQSYWWHEVWEGDESVGIIYVQLQGDDADLHIMFFDRKPAEKKELVKFFCRFLFDHLPELVRISCSVPEIYYATGRLAMAIGKWEGKKRQAVVIGGKRVDVNLYGLLREEVYGIPERQDQGNQHHSERHPANSIADSRAT